jgi:hypothetical protein
MKMGLGMGVSMESREFGRTRPERTREIQLPETNLYWEGVRKNIPNDIWCPVDRKSYLEQGVEFVVSAHELRPDTLVLMDKSARPLGLFFHELWKRIYPDEPIPHVLFMVGNNNSDNTPQPEKVRKAFSSAFNNFNDKSILLIEENVMTGRTLGGVADSLREAFPEIREIYTGTMNQVSTRRHVSVDIDEPEGSYYYEGDHSNLGDVLYGLSDEYVKEVENEDGRNEVLVQSIHGANTEENPSRLLGLVGRTETLDEKSLQGLEMRFNSQSEKERTQLENLKKAYLKLMK